MKYGFILVLTGILMLLPYVNTAQETTFSRTCNAWPSTHEAQVYGVIESPDSHYLLAGFYDGKGLVSTTNLDGQQLGSKIFDYGIETSFYFIVSLPDSHHLVAGSGGPNNNIVVVKLNAVQDTVWTRSLDLGHQDHVTSLQPTNDSGCVIGGISYLGYPQRDTVFVIKLDPEGFPEWAVKFAPEENSNLYSVRPSEDGGYLVCGSVSTTNPYHQTPFLLKLDTHGALLWSWKLTQDPHLATQGYDVLEISDGFLFFCGSFGSHIIRTDTAGSAVWTLFLNVSGYSEMPYDFGPRLLKYTDNTYFFTILGQWGGLCQFNASGEGEWLGTANLDVSNILPLENHQTLTIGNGPMYGVDHVANLPLQFGLIKNDSSNYWTECSHKSTNLYPNTVDAEFIPFSVDIIPVDVSVHHDTLQLSEVMISEQFGCVDMYSSIEEEDSPLMKLEIAPNPSSGRIALSVSGEMPATLAQNISLMSLEIFDLTGKKIYSSSTPLLLPSTLNFTHFPEGMYFVSWKTKTHNGTQKLLIIH